MSNVVFTCVCLIVCVTLLPKAAITCGDKIAAAGGGYTSYSAADKILRRLTAYEACGSLRLRLADVMGQTVRSFQLVAV